MLWLTSAICDSCWLFLARTKINIALAKAEGHYAHAQMLPLFWQPFFPLALHHCAAKFFCFSCYLIEFCCLPVCSCSCFCLRGNPVWIFEVYKCVQICVCVCVCVWVCVSVSVCVCVSVCLSVIMSLYGWDCFCVRWYGIWVFMGILFNA